MNEIQLNELKSRAEKLKNEPVYYEINIQGKMILVDGVFSKIGEMQGIGEVGEHLSYKIEGIILTPTGKSIRRPLLEIVQFIESKKH